jgi:catechol 2,3-dioxygenase-like lactoylglutathione lyase family enzyme
MVLRRRRPYCSVRNDRNGARQGETMFSHVTIGTNNLDPASRFYQPVMAALGHERFYTSPEAIGFGSEGNDQTWIMLPLDDNPARTGNGIMIAFVAPDRESVRQAHQAAMDNGGIDEGAPGLRPDYHANYFGAYVRDPTGNKLCFVCHKPE